MNHRQHYANQYTVPAWLESDALRLRLKREHRNVSPERLCAMGCPLQAIRCRCWLNGALHLVEAEVEHVRRWLDGEEIAFYRGDRPGGKIL